MATLRIEYISDNGHLCSVEHEAAEMLCQDQLTIQMALCNSAYHLLPDLAEQIACGTDDRPDCRGILGSK